MTRIICVAWWTVNGNALITAASVCAYVMPAGAVFSGGAFVNITTRMSISIQGIATWTRTFIRAWHIITVTHAQAIAVLHFTFVDIDASAIVGTQFITTVTSTTVTAVVINASLLAKSGNIGTLVDI